jgi:hypothetical protein
MKRLLIILILFSSINFNGFAQSSDVHQLNAQMKSFRSRMRVYAKCLTGKCTTQERNVAAKAALKDGAITIGTIVILAGLTIGGRWLYTKKQKYDFLKYAETPKAGGLSSIMVTVEGALRIALEKVDQEKKLKVSASEGTSGPQIDTQQEFPDMKCQTEVRYSLADHDTKITLKRCDNQVIIDVNRFGSLTSYGEKLFLTDLYKESKIYKLSLPMIERLKSDHNIDKIVIHVPLEIDDMGYAILEDAQGNSTIKTIEI